MLKLVLSLWTATKCRQNNGQKINAVMFWPKSKLQIMWWIIRTGRVNSHGLSVKHAAALAWQRPFCKQSNLFEGFFLCIYPFFFKIVHYFVDKTESLSTCHNSQIAVLSPILSTKHLSTTALAEITRNLTKFHLPFIEWHALIRIICRKPKGPWCSVNINTKDKRGNKKLFFGKRPSGSQWNISE